MDNDIVKPKEKCLASCPFLKRRLEINGHCNGDVNTW